MKTALPLNQLIAKANEELKEHSWYEEGMEIKEAKMVGTILTRSSKTRVSRALERICTFIRIQIHADLKLAGISDLPGPVWR